MALGAGLRFAVPEINNLASTGWTDAIGARAYGPRGERYVVAFNDHSVSFGASQVIFYKTATNSDSTQHLAFLPYNFGTADSGSGSCAGIMASSLASRSIGWVQCQGIFTASLTSSAMASNAFSRFVAVNTASSGRWQVTAASTASDANVVPPLGVLAHNVPGTITAISTVPLVMYSGLW